MTTPWLRTLGLVGAMVTVVVVAATALANPARANPGVTPGMRVEGESGSCTAGFAAQGYDGSYYLMTSGHCDKHDGSVWTYGNDVPLGKITASEQEGDNRDAAVILLDPSVGVPRGAVGSRYRVRDVLSGTQIQVGMPFCKIGAASGETCGVVADVEGDVVETNVLSLSGDSGSPGFVKNPDGTVSAVGLLMSSPEGDDSTTYFVLVNPLLSNWGLRVLP
ncbi:MAG: S1 family peptidase [Mycobacterium sp.]